MSSAPPPATLSPEGRVIAISGAARGLGASIARTLYAEGYALSLGVRDLARARSQLQFDESRVSYHFFDATDFASIDAWIEATAQRHGRLDGLVNNAGILKKVTFDDGDEADLDELFQINVKAPFRTIRRALPHLRKAGAGRIVNIASTDGKRIRDNSVSIGYAMSKHALVALSHAARMAAWDDGVRATALCPGAIDTDLLANFPGAIPPAGRLRPETVAEIVSLLLRLPNPASVAELALNMRLESTL